jgi:hypothetical protein
MTSISDEGVQKPFILNNKEERILDLLRLVGSATAEDIHYVLFRDRSTAYIRSLLARLCGGHDFAESEFLYRYPVPSTAKGTKQRAYSLGTRARELRTGEVVYRISKGRYLSFHQTWHNLSLTRFVCSALVLCETDPQVRLADLRLSYDLARELAKREAGTDVLPPPVPDGWLNFELLDHATGAHTTYLPIWLEADMGTMYRVRFQEHLEDRIEFVRSGKYADFFGSDAVRVAYAAIGTRAELRPGRLAAMRAWAKEVLADLALDKDDGDSAKDWTNVFYFTALVYEELYDLKHFSQPVWFTPAAPTPKRLLEP